MTPLIWARRIELMGSFCNLWKTMRREKLHSSWFISPNWSKWENECLRWCKTNNWICKVELYTSQKIHLRIVPIYENRSCKCVSKFVKPNNTSCTLLFFICQRCKMPFNTEFDLHSKSEGVHKLSFWMKIGWVLLTINFVLGGLKVDNRCFNDCWRDPLILSFLE